MTDPDYTELVEAQRAYFKSGATRPLEWREGQLKAMVAMFTENREEMFEALRHDLRRDDVDSDLMDVAFCINEANYALEHLHKWNETEPVHTPIVLRPGHVRVRRDPLGVTLIIGAWNEPLELIFAPLAPALAAGNTAVLKPSELSTATSALAARLVPQYFDPQAVAVVEGGIPETSALLAQHWSLIFFTGSPQVGKIIHAAAAKNLTPCVLELGGKSPAIVHSSADLETAARRIAFGRYTNAGQVCTAPDHVLVWPEVKDDFVGHLVRTISEFYGDDPQKSPDFGRIINKKSVERLGGLMGSGKIAAGGTVDVDDSYVAPTVIVDPDWDSPIMSEEVFGPILPVLEIGSEQDAIDWVNRNPRPLGLYIFADDHDVAERILDATESGDAGVNECTIHPLIPELPFGGVGNSGMGKYHGRWGFEAFTNARGVLYHSPKIDPGVRYPPYSEHQRERAIESKLM